MALSRLDNLLKSVRGNAIYVDKHSLDSSDSIENRGNSPIRPFISVQRAIIECARFSYQRGLNNDRFAETTIVVGSGIYDIDNRPGFIPDTSNNYVLRNGQNTDDFPAWDLTTNFDITTNNNALYKLNSIYGGVILPRGCSLVSAHSDLRKTIFRPKYVPNPENDNIERSAIFRLTGGNFLWGFSILDSNPNGICYKDYTTNTYVPNFSHHKLSCFEYCDGVNPVSIKDTFITYSTERTDLDMYYEKVGLAYGQSSGREIQPDYPTAPLDIQAKIDEYRIVGPTGGEIGITTIRAGNGTISTPIITVSLDSGYSGLDVDTTFQIEGISSGGYNGQYVVSDVISVDSNGTTEFEYQVQNAPTNPLPGVTGSKVSLSVDTVTSASPYIFNISLRSVYGMCGVHADGNKATGFKSMVVAQFTGIGLQKDDKAFVKYDSSSGTYKNSSYADNENIHSDSLARFTPSYENFHIKASNNAFMQLVSIFAIGYATHFVAESGGDFSITNSNSNFGAKALQASGFRNVAFGRDDVGYITHIIPPKQLTTTDNGIEFDAVDVVKTIGVGVSSRLYLYNQQTLATPPQNVIEGYRIGARSNDTLNVQFSANEYSANIVMPNTEITGEKKYIVGRSVGINSIASNILTFTSSHTFGSGESVRFYSDNSRLPDGVDNNRLYYAITTGLGANQIKISQTLNDAINGQELAINNMGGVISVSSKVSDKNSGDIGHPIQWDSGNSQWYIGVSTVTNTIYPEIVSLGTAALGAATPRTYIKRNPDTRNLIDTIYRLRYVIPSGSGVISARPPSDGFILQESNDTSGATNTEVNYSYSPTSVTMSNVNELRNFKFIADANWNISDNTASIFTELPHLLSIGSQIEITNVTSTNNTTGTKNVGYNGTFDVIGISSSKHFSVDLTVDPGTFTNNTSARTTDLPQFARKRYNNTYYIYRSQEIKKYIPGKQDGVYHLIVLNSSNSPTVDPFTNLKLSQPIKDLYPQANRDEPESNPKSSVSFALPSMIGQVVTDDPKHSITRETIDKNLVDSRIGFGITDIVSNNVGTSHTIHTDIDHGLNRITTVNTTYSGSGYGYGAVGNLYNAQLVGFAGSTTGSHATARITVDGTGSITAVKIMDGGSAYGIGNTLTVVGVATTTGYSPAVLTVTKVYNNVGDSLRISGVDSEDYIEYNDLYRITNIPVGNTKSIIVSSASTISNSVSSVGSILTTNAYGYLTGSSLSVSSLVYDSTTGIATVTTAQNHGLQVDNQIRLSGATNNLFNGDFIVRNNFGITTFTLNIGTSDTSPATTGTIYAHRNGFIANDGNVSFDNENIGGRMVLTYAGITTTLFAAISNATTEDVSITDITSLDINIGDYLIIDNELVRVKTTVTTNPVKVFRGILGTRAVSHDINSVVRRVKISPIELRRNSIIRASGHTFEYIGFGPGNYSTALPERQDRILSSQEELLAQSLKLDGGVTVYTGMNSAGDSYAGNKKLSYSTGQEEIFDAPIPTVAGEDVNISGADIGYDILTPTDATISNSLRVEGGPSNNIISEFDGPVIFNNKITSTSNKGIEAASLFMQGDVTVSRKYTVGVTQPSIAGNPGDVVYNANPTKGSTLGWVYTIDNGWYGFGNISISDNSNIITFDGVGIGTTNGTYKLQVNGNTNIIGTCYATKFSGDGSLLTNLDPSLSGWVNITNGIYNTSLNNVGIGTSVPRFNLELGAVGSSTTSIYVNGEAKFVGFITANNIFVSGMLTASSYKLNGLNGTINAGIITTSTLNVGTGGTILSTISTGVGIGTSSPRATLDIEGHTRFKTYSEVVETLTSSSGVVTIDLAKAQTFTFTPSEAVTSFTLLNPPTGSTAFTIKITQGSTGYSVNIDNFNSGSIPIYWSGGGVVPTVTTTANRTDIYSFKIFDGTNVTTAGMFGIVGGQNFL